MPLQSDGLNVMCLRGNQDGNSEFFGGPLGGHFCENLVPNGFSWIQKSPSNKDFSSIAI